jgi:hypothetical protein
MAFQILIGEVTPNIQACIEAVGQYIRLINLKTRVRIQS